MRSDSVKNMSAYADQNHAPSLAAARLELTGYYKTHYNNVETHSAGTGRIVYQVSWVLDLKVWIVKL